MIGNRLWEDIIFGNLNQMKTVYVTKLNKYTGEKLKASPLYTLECHLHELYMNSGPFMPL